MCGVGSRVLLDIVTITCYHIPMPKFPQDYVDTSAFADDYETAQYLDEMPDEHELDLRRATYIDWSQVDAAGIFEE